MTKSERKKDREEYLLKCFMEIFKNFPQEKHEQGESPDFLFTSENGETIGIELADVLTDQRFQEHLSIQKKLADKVVLHLDKLLPFTFALTLKIYRGRVKSTEISNLSKEITDCCYEELLELGENKTAFLRNLNKSFETFSEQDIARIIQQGFRELPPQLKSIEIRRTNKIGYSFNTQATGISMPDLDFEHIADLLEDKNEKLKKYIKANQQWLVLCIGHGPSTYFSNINIEPPIVSDFTKVYLLRVDNREVMELK